ncbi:MAG: glycosyltransferase [Phycisphaerales bacterium]
MKTSTRMDMHCHSSASREPVAPWLGAWQVPESYSPPEKVYDQARSRGMDLVTITDHDTIDGVLSLVERGFPNVIIGEEVTTHFPEDRCRLHVLVWGLTPARHEEIEKLGLREDVYHFAHWLFTHNLAHSLAHPLYSQNGKLTTSHLERCVLLFKAWESLNGAHAPTHKDGVELFLSSLKLARVQAFERRHRMRALWMRSWTKAVTAGSDDHALLNVGRTWTEVEQQGDDADDTSPVPPKSRSGDFGAPVQQHPMTPDLFLRQVMAGRGQVKGQAGHSALLAHQMMAVTANHYAHAFAQRGSAKSRAVGATAARFAGADIKPPSKAALALDAAKAALNLGRLPGLAGLTGQGAKARGSSGLSPLSPVIDELARAVPSVLEKHPAIIAALSEGAAATPDGPAFARHKEMAAFIDDLTGTLTASCAAGLIKAFEDRDHAAAARSLLTGLIATAAQLPTIYAMFHQNKERDLLTRLEHDTSLLQNAERPSPLDRPLRVSLFTDTLGDINGVCRFIQNVASQAQQTGRDLEVITSTAMPVPKQPNLFNFEPVFHTKMPGYETLEIVLPPLLKILRHLDEHQPDVVHVSTPGPVGLIGLIAARMLRVPVIGVYHTDFPAYIDRLFDDFTFTSACEWGMRTFYSGFRTVFTRSGDYVKSLVNLGIDPDRIERLMPGLEVSQFNPTYFDPNLWRRIEGESERFDGLSRDSVKVLYVGRVSVEKNIHLLERVWKRVAKRCLRSGLTADLVIVGDGPARPELEKSLKGTHAHFLGFRHGEELSRLYASSNLFAFPSVTDTLGQVVMEAQASGIPVLVTDQGGPKEVVKHGVTGLVLNVNDPDSEDHWVASLCELIENQDRREQMGRAAADSMRTHDIAHTFEHFWSAHEDARREHLARLGIKPRHKQNRDRPSHGAARDAAGGPISSEVAAGGWSNGHAVDEPTDGLFSTPAPAEPKS